MRVVGVGKGSWGICSVGIGDRGSSISSHGNWGGMSNCHWGRGGNSMDVRGGCDLGVDVGLSGRTSSTF